MGREFAEVLLCGTAGLALVFLYVLISALARLAYGMWGPAFVVVVLTLCCVLWVLATYLLWEYGDDE